MPDDSYPNQLTSIISRPGLEIRFLGRRASSDRREALRAQSASPGRLARLQQVHSSRVLPARSGLCGEADALWTREKGLALSIATADCVPVVLSGESSVAAAHAGWRGIASGVVANTVRALGDPPSLTAWIGPAARGCCYEVSPSVAEALTAASDSSALRRGKGERPHVDLVAAIETQLRRSGVATVHDLSPCTLCHDDEYWSFRRFGKAAGRNYTFAWLTDGGATSSSDRFRVRAESSDRRGRS